ncbi:MAG: YdcF family protein [Nitrospinae bacterium]|nr:YdcF family protein [Nitrospinota bacterium]
MNRFRFTTIRERRVLTPWGWGVLSGTFVALSVLFILTAYSFLAPTRSIQGEILVVEGWLPDYALEKVRDRFQSGNYKLLVTSGGELPIGSHLSRYKTWAQLAAATLQVLGVQAEKILTVPAPSVQKDRTYAAVLEVKKQLAQKGLSPASIDIVSFGPHSRRTWMMFKLIFSPGVQVGVISIEPRDYDVSRWWVSSAGVRNVISETVAYLYARLIFSPPA